MLDPTPNVRHLAEAELRRSELQARLLTKRLGYFGAAFLIAAFAGVMLALAAFFALSGIYGEPLAALITSAGLMTIAALAFFFASRGPRRNDRLELELAEQTIEHARGNIEKDFAAIERELDRFTFGLLSLLKGSASETPLLALLLGGLAAWSPTIRRLVMPFLRRR